MQRPLYQDRLVEKAEQPSQMQRGGMNGFGVRRVSRSTGIGRAVTVVAAERSAITARRLICMPIDFCEANVEWVETWSNGRRI